MRFPRVQFVAFPCNVVIAATSRASSARLTGTDVRLSRFGFRSGAPAFVLSAVAPLPLSPPPRAYALHRRWPYMAGFHQKPHGGYAAFFFGFSPGPALFK